MYCWSPSRNLQQKELVEDAIVATRLSAELSTSGRMPSAMASSIVTSCFRKRRSPACSSRGGGRGSPPFGVEKRGPVTVSHGTAAAVPTLFGCSGERTRRG